MAASRRRCCAIVAARAALTLSIATIVYPPAFVQAQSDGVVFIDQTRALAGAITPGDAADFPVTLGQPGSYRLAGNLTVAGPDATAIEITADNVTLDLNGFTISGPAGACRQTLRPTWCSQTTRGVGVLGRQVGTSALHSNIAVFGGTIRAMGSHGLVLGASARVERVAALDNRGHGIYATLGALIADNTSRRNGGAGISCFSCLAFGNTVLESGSQGLRGYYVLFGNNLVAGEEAAGIPIVISGGGVNAGGNLCVPGLCPP